MFEIGTRSKLVAKMQEWKKWWWDAKQLSAIIEVDWNIKSKASPREHVCGSRRADGALTANNVLQMFTANIRYKSSVLYFLTSSALFTLSIKAGSRGMRCALLRLERYFLWAFFAYSTNAYCDQHKTFTAHASRYPDPPLSSKPTRPSMTYEFTGTSYVI